MKIFYDINFIIKLNLTKQFKVRPKQKIIIFSRKSLFNFLYFFLFCIKFCYFFKKTKITKTDKNFQLQYTAFLFFFNDKKLCLQDFFFNFDKSKIKFFKKFNLNINTIKVYNNHQYQIQEIFNKINYNENKNIANTMLLMFKDSNFKKLKLMQLE